ncbi:LysM peptidoglycan-binding domain-containing protein [Vibrio profundum]|uniref:LysM peptidoglycan-binding domain-containing protein n=1 Tax=Vibrio profundum TaxID=2910247 RepID=UPI003D0CCB6E
MIAKLRRGAILCLTLALWAVPGLVWANSLEAIRVWPSPDETRVVLDLKSDLDYSYFMLSNPSRLVVDLKKTRLQTKLPIKVGNSAVLSKIRKSSPPTKSTYRLVFELKKKLKAKLFELPPAPLGPHKHRLVIDLPHSQSAQAAPSTRSRKGVKTDAPKASGNKEIVVAIDPGHGGEDPGSIGPTGKYEKTVTLAIAKKIAHDMDAIPGIRAVLTRTGDYYVGLNKRTEIARHDKAYILVSIHADAFMTPQPRGASVFVLNTRRANTEIARWVENSEAQSELLGGAGQVLAKNSDDKNVSQTLLDLQFSHSQNEGYKLASDILKQLAPVARLHRSKPVYASLAVLKSPDIPSVLVETGFISNPIEERLLFQPSHQNNIARAITEAVVKYFEVEPPPGTLFAQRLKSQSYKVKRGDSLSRVAQKMGTSVSALVKANNLKRTSLYVGQVLKVPSRSTPNIAPRKVSDFETKIVTHVVQRGDYLGRIADKYKVSVAQIKKENSLRSNTLFVGQKLNISVSLRDLPLRKYKVRRGEYLGKIASRYGVSVSSLRRVNKLTTNELAIGQVLIIPHK